MLNCKMQQASTEPVMKALESENSIHTHKNQSGIFCNSSAVCKDSVILTPCSRNFFG